MFTFVIRTEIDIQNSGIKAYFELINFNNLFYFIVIHTLLAVLEWRTECRSVFKAQVLKKCEVGCFLKLLY